MPVGKEVCWWSWWRSPSGQRASWIWSKPKISGRLIKEFRAKRDVRGHLDAGKDCRLEERGMTEGEMVGWHHPSQWTWVCVSSGSWWWTGKPGVLQSMGSWGVGHDWVTELSWEWGNLKLVERLSGMRWVTYNQDTLSVSLLCPEQELCKHWALSLCQCPLKHLCRSLVQS